MMRIVYYYYYLANMGIPGVWFNGLQWNITIVVKTVKQWLLQTGGPFDKQKMAGKSYINDGIDEKTLKLNDGFPANHVWVLWVPEGTPNFQLRFLILVGGLEHVLFFPYIGKNHPNWLSYFSEG